jgi:hypothetical protein
MHVCVCMIFVHIPWPDRQTKRQTSTHIHTGTHTYTCTHAYVVLPAWNCLSFSYALHLHTYIQVHIHIHAHTHSVPLSVLHTPSAHKLLIYTHTKMHAGMHKYIHKHVYIQTHTPAALPACHCLFCACQGTSAHTLPLYIPENIQIHICMHTYT